MRSYLVRRAIEKDGVPHGLLTVVAPPDGMAFGEFEDVVVDTFFAGPVQVMAGELEVDGGGTVVTSNGALPQWASYGDEFVTEAIVEQDGTGRWAWFWNDMLWIVEVARPTPWARPTSPMARTTRTAARSTGPSTSPSP